MKALIQRVNKAEVEIDGKLYGKIGKGILVFVGVEKGDAEDDITYLVKKISNLRIFEDAEKKMNLSVQDIGGEVLVVSQFTLSADCRKGNRPSFGSAEEPSKAKQMYIKLIERLKINGIKISMGDFGASMQISLTNNGPVTIILDSRE